jgi:hypothetical protein
MSLNGPTSGYKEGVVQVFDNGRWGSICDKGFDTAAKRDNFAKATCKSLGHLKGEWVTPKANTEGLIS